MAKISIYNFFIFPFKNGFVGVLAIVEFTDVSGKHKTDAEYDMTYDINSSKPIEKIIWTLVSCLAGIVYKECSIDPKDVSVKLIVSGADERITKAMLKKMVKPRMVSWEETPKTVGVFCGKELTEKNRFEVVDSDSDFCLYTGESMNPTRKDIDMAKKLNSMLLVKRFEGKMQ
ncbi:MAG: hypothetical protein KKB03_00325 [Nanoarchaeota archaeon]|nr:hypothetical protein [Nanoarchaeota archaeon]MBU2519674.1 hypothetical protein [Nanoarchaeota archaeon]